MTITAAQVFINQSHIEVDRPPGYRANGVPDLFRHHSLTITGVSERAPVSQTDRIAYLTFHDGSVAVAAQCKPDNSNEPPTWKIAEARTSRDQPPRPPADPEGPEWLWIGGQERATEWVQQIEKMLASTARTIPG